MIVGGGPAGLSAAIWQRALLDTVVQRKMRSGGWPGITNFTEVENWPWHAKH